MNITNSAAEGSNSIAIYTPPTYITVPGGANVPVSLPAGNYSVDTDIEVFLGKSDGALSLYFPGGKAISKQSDLSSLAPAVNFGTAGFSFIWWGTYENSGTETDIKLVHSDSNTGTPKINLSIVDNAGKTNPTIRFAVTSNEGNVLIDHTTSFYAPLMRSAQIKNIAVSFDRTSLLLRIFLDGTLVSQAAIASGFATDTVNPAAYATGASTGFTLGAVSSTGAPNSQVGSVLCFDTYKTALTTAQIVERVTLGPSGMPLDGIYPDGRMSIASRSAWGNPNIPEFQTISGTLISTFDSTWGTTFDINAGITPFASGGWVNHKNGVRVTYNSKQVIEHSGGYLNIYSRPQASGEVRIHAL